MMATALIFALLLDALLGEPKWLWSRLTHPVVLMGRAINFIDTRFNSGPNQRLMGTLSFAALTIASGALGWLLTLIPGDIVDILIAAIFLAHRSLTQHVSSVADALRISLGDGRRAVAMIVGRDTADMPPAAVATSAIESAAENFSDGVTAPAFWFLIGGLPGLLIYKITNTADSMIGYRTPRHESFGWAAARFDDLLNYIPARLTALLIAPCAFSGLGRDANQHRSPNAGWPEAAMARTLNVALSGPRSYDGIIKDYAYVNEQGAHDLTSDHIDAAITILWRTWATLFAGTALFALFIA
jgi:adenosylcobinamide-phosphate synthase